MLNRSTLNSSLFVVKNGVDTEYWNPQVVLPSEDSGLVIFTGIMNYEPNQDAMVYCLQEIWPRIKEKVPYAKLRIIGRYPRRELLQIAMRNKDVEVTSEVEDIRQAAKGAQVFLCPIRIGAEMKNKILEALSMGIPVVTTSQGASGIQFESGKIGYIAEKPQDLESYTAPLIEKRSLWREFSEASRDLTQGKYSWGQEADKLSNGLVI